jgi:hypothetical protein
MERSPITKVRSQWREVPPRIRLSDEVEGIVFQRNVHDGVLRVIVAEEPLGWHLSISHTAHNRRRPPRYPTWDEMADARYALLPADIDVVMHLPPEAEYVAVHDTTFHLHEHPERTP